MTIAEVRTVELTNSAGTTVGVSITEVTTAAVTTVELATPESKDWCCKDS